MHIIRNMVAKLEKLHGLFSDRCMMVSNKLAINVTHIWILIALALSP